MTTHKSGYVGGVGAPLTAYEQEQRNLIKMGECDPIACRRCKYQKCCCRELGLVVGTVKIDKPNRIVELLENKRNPTYLLDTVTNELFASCGGGLFKKRKNSAGYFKKAEFKNPMVEIPFYKYKEALEKDLNKDWMLYFNRHKRLCIGFVQEINVESLKVRINDIWYEDVSLVGFVPTGFYYEHFNPSRN